MTSDSNTQHVPSALMQQTLLNPDLVRPATKRPVVRLLPQLKVVKLGGRSILDKGRDAILPIVDELKQLLAERNLLVATGSGIRGRHVMGVGLDMGLPTGALAALASSEAEQNGHIIAALLAEHGVSYLPHTTVGRQLAAHLAASPAVVCNGFPPYELFDHPPAVGKIPPHRTDAGAFLIADAYGAQRLVYASDVDGIYDADPHQNSGAKLLRKVTVDELIGMELATLPIDRLVLDLMRSAKHMAEIQVVNGLDRGNITRALAGERVGTIVRA